jgi:hypothetical protein
MAVSVTKLREIYQQLRKLGPEGRYAAVKARAIRNIDDRYDFCIREGRRIAQAMQYRMKYKSEPVSIQEFVESSAYLNQNEVLYPEVMKVLTEINSGKYIEAVLTGGIGTGKTTIALLTNAYQLYLLSLLRDPHKEYGLMASDEIVFVFQSISGDLSKGVDYMRFRNLIEGSPYFQQYFPFRKDIESELRFPNRIIVKPVSGQDTAAIGQNVFGGLLDEVNFMAVVENSKVTKDGSSYDQAWANYNALVRRRESRFMKQGVLPGVFCLVSSKQYPGEFTDVKIKQAEAEKKKYGTTQVYVYDKRVWEVKPISAFSGKWFHVFIGDAARKPFIVGDGKYEGDDPFYLNIPEEYKKSFEADIYSALRDIGGVATYAKHPFMLNTDLVAACFGKTQNVLSREEVDFVTTVPMILPERIKRFDAPRFVHIDTSLTGDSTGFACGYVDGFVTIDRDEHAEILPKIVFDFLLEVKPPKNGEIRYEDLRVLLYNLRDLGVNIKWVSMDSFQSADMIQILQRRGFLAGIQSIDTTTNPYDITKAALYDGRVLLPIHDKAQKELISLERDPATAKIDHPPKGSKDVADAIAGVVYGLTMRREIWVAHGIALTEIPDSIMMKAKSGKNSVDNKA